MKHSVRVHGSVTSTEEALVTPQHQSAARLEQSTAIRVEAEHLTKDRDRLAQRAPRADHVLDHKRDAQH